MEAQKEYDVFLSYNHHDREEVEAIGEQLKEQGVKPWFDQWDLIPGRPWQRALEHQIERSKTAAVFFGAHDIGKWQELESNAFMREFAKRDCPVIPVILKSAPMDLDLPLFLQGMHQVDFRKERPHPLEKLIEGITTVKPNLPPLKSEPKDQDYTYQFSRDGNKGMVQFTLNGTMHTLNFLRKDNLFANQVFSLKRGQQVVARLEMPFATFKAEEKSVAFKIDGVDCLFTVKMSAVTSIISVKLVVGGIEVFHN